MRLELERGPATPSRVTAMLEPLLASARTGLVSALRDDALLAEDAEDAAGVRLVSGKVAHGPVAGSCGFDVEAARVRALGEAVERYALSTAATWVRTTRLSPREALARGALDPRRLALPSAEERARHPAFSALDLDAPVAWVEGWRLRPDAEPEPALLPAQAALAHHRCEAHGEPRFAWASSSGTGAGNTVVEAARSGLREVLERDAFALAWLARRPVPHLDVDRVADARVRAWRDHHAARGRRASLAWLTSDLGFPVVMAQVEDAGPLHHVAGFGASLDPAHAIRRAVEEAEQGRILLKHLFRSGARVPPEDAPVDSLEKQILWWQDAARAARLDFLTRPRDTLDPRALEDATGATPWDDVRTVLRLLEEKGLEAFAVDLTPPEVRGRMPLRVVSTLVPGCQPVRMADKPACLDGPRARAALEGGGAPPWRDVPPPFA